MKIKEGGVMDIQKEREAFEIVFSVPEGVVWCYAKNRYIAKNTSFIFACAAFNSAFEVWQAAKAHESKKLEGFVLVPHGVLDLTRFMCKTWSEIDKFVYKNCSDIGQYPVIQGTQNQLNLSRIGEQQINANEINKGVNWLLEAAQEPANDP